MYYKQQTEILILTEFKKHFMTIMFNNLKTPLTTIYNKVTSREIVDTIIKTTVCITFSMSAMQLHRRAGYYEYSGFLKPLYDRVVALDNQEIPWLPVILTFVSLDTFLIYLWRNTNKKQQVNNTTPLMEVNVPPLFNGQIQHV